MAGSGITPTVGLLEAGQELIDGAISFLLETLLPREGTTRPTLPQGLDAGQEVEDDSTDTQGRLASCLPTKGLLLDECELAFRPQGRKAHERGARHLARLHAGLVGCQALSRNEGGRTCNDWAPLS
jgi:hypothetical protein